MSSPQRIVFKAQTFPKPDSYVIYGHQIKKNLVLWEGGWENGGIKGKKGQRLEKGQGLRLGFSKETDRRELRGNQRLSVTIKMNPNDI